MPLLTELEEGHFGRAPSVSISATPRKDATPIILHRQRKQHAPTLGALSSGWIPNWEMHQGGCTNQIAGSVCLGGRPTTKNHGVVLWARPPRRIIGRGWVSATARTDLTPDFQDTLTISSEELSQSVSPFAGDVAPALLYSASGKYSFTLASTSWSELWRPS